MRLRTAVSDHLTPTRTRPRCDLDAPVCVDLDHVAVAFAVKDEIGLRAQRNPRNEKVQTNATTWTDSQTGKKRVFA
eukprot:5775978-Pleurochrysis_carterae.AAC.5